MPVESQLVHHAGPSASLSQLQVCIMLCIMQSLSCLVYVTVCSTNWTHGSVHASANFLQQPRPCCCVVQLRVCWGPCQLVQQNTCGSMRTCRNRHHHAETSTTHELVHRLQLSSPSKLDTHCCYVGRARSGPRGLLLTLRKTPGCPWAAA